MSNHVGSIDDPLITSAVVPQEYLLRPEVGSVQGQGQGGKVVGALD